MSRAGAIAIQVLLGLVIVFRGREIVHLVVTQWQAMKYRERLDEWGEDVRW